MRSRLRAKALAGFGTCFFCVERSPFAVWRLKRQRPLLRKRPFVGLVAANYHAHYASATLSDSSSPSFMPTKRSTFDSQCSPCNTRRTRGVLLNLAVTRPVRLAAVCRRDDASRRARCARQYRGGQFPRPGEGLMEGRPAEAKRHGRRLPPNPT